MDYSFFLDMSYLQCLVPLSSNDRAIIWQMETWYKRPLMFIGLSDMHKCSAASAWNDLRCVPRCRNDHWMLTRNMLSKLKHCCFVRFVYDSNCVDVYWNDIFGRQASDVYQHYEPFDFFARRNAWPNTGASLWMFWHHCKLCWPQLSSIS